jgi:hypothetical protein
VVAASGTRRRQAVLDSPHVLVGTVEEIADELQHRRERWGFSYIAFGLDTYHHVIPVVSRLAGT